MINRYLYLKGVIFVMIFAVTAQNGFSQSSYKLPGDGIYAEINTTKGAILVSLEYEKTPITVISFTGLAEGKIDGGQGIGKPFYDRLNFHRVINNFMIQGGCPLGTGTGNPGYTFPDEFHRDLKHSGPGILSMANSGPGTNGSQFFITHDSTAWLDGKHTVFGKVVEGINVVNAIRQGDKINSIKIIRQGTAARNFKNDFNALKALVLKSEEEGKKVFIEQMEKDKALISRNWPKAEKTSTGLMYIINKQGRGTASPVMGSQVVVHYKGMFLDGTVFDSSHQRGQPLEFSVGQVIQGWNEALIDMKKGEQRTLIIPPDLAYGSAGAGGVIPPYSYLLFEVELIDFR